MSENKQKYFCHFGDLKVKDAEAREHLENLQEEVTNKQTLKEVNKNTNVAFWVGTEEEFENEADLTEATTICYVDTPIEEQIEDTITEITDEKLNELTDKITEIETNLSNHQHSYNMLMSNGNFKGDALYGTNIFSFYGYMVIVEIEEHIYEDARVTIPLMFYYNEENKTCGWQGYGCMCIKADETNSKYYPAHITVDINGTYEYVDGKCKITLGDTILSLRDNNVEHSDNLDIVTLLIKQIP